MRTRVYVIKILVIAGFALGIICLKGTALGGEKTYLKKSNLDSRKTVVYDHNPKGQDKAKGYLRKSYLDSRKTIVYDANGKEQGYFRKSYLDSRKTVYVPKED